MAENTNYVENIRNGLTLSGTNVDLMAYTAGYEEYFCGEAWMHLKLNKKSKKNEERVCALIRDFYDQCLDFNLYELDGNNVHEKDFISVYVFYLLDELANFIIEKKDGWEAIDLINKLWWCMLSIDPQLKSSRSTAKKAAAARHAENRSMKKDAFDWYREHGRELKNDDAAIAIKGLVPISLRTAQDWVSEFRKTIRSAGTTTLCS